MSRPGRDATGDGRARTDDATIRPLTRRSVLAAVGAAGIAGGLGGAATGAFLRDAESVTAGFRGRTLNLAVSWHDAPRTETSDGAFVLDLGTLAPGESGSARLDASLPGGDNAPAYLWLGFDCPRPATAFASALSVGLTYVDEFGSSFGAVVRPGSLVRVAERLTGGVALDGVPWTPGRQPLEPGRTLRLRLDYVLATDYVGEESVSLRGRVVATQAAHDDGTDNPFAGHDRRCPRRRPGGDAGSDTGTAQTGATDAGGHETGTADACSDCVALGRHDVPSGHAVSPGDRLPLASPDGSLAGYDLLVAVPDAGPPATVTLVPTGADAPTPETPPVCEVRTESSDAVTTVAVAPAAITAPLGVPPADLTGVAVAVCHGDVPADAGTAEGGVA